MELETLISELESTWDENGFLGGLRNGEFWAERGDRLATLIESIVIDGQLVDRRLVSLLWYIPIFMEWNKSRACHSNGDKDNYRRLGNRIQAALERILGAP